MLRRVHRQLKAEDTLHSSHDIWWIVQWAEIGIGLVDALDHHGVNDLLEAGLVLWGERVHDGLEN